HVVSGDTFATRRVPSLEELLRLPYFEGLAGRYRNGHHLVAVTIEELAAAVRPHRFSPRPNRKCAPRTRVRSPMNFGMARFVGYVCHPAAIGRKPGGELGERRFDIWSGLAFGVQSKLPDVGSGCGIGIVVPCEQQDAAIG